MALAENHYYAGKSVYLDHGGGVISFTCTCRKLLCARRSDFARADRGKIRCYGTVHGGPISILRLCLQGKLVDPSPLFGPEKPSGETSESHERRRGVGSGGAGTRTCGKDLEQRAGGRGALFALSPHPGTFRQLTAAHPYLLGILKIGALGAMGDMLAVRMREANGATGASASGTRPWSGAFLGSFSWWCSPFSVGTEFLFRHGYLSNPFEGFGARALGAFAASSFMNLLFAPTMMVFHRV